MIHESGFIKVNPRQPKKGMGLLEKGVERAAEREPGGGQPKKGVV